MSHLLHASCIYIAYTEGKPLKGLVCTPIVATWGPICLGETAEALQKL